MFRSRLALLAILPGTQKRMRLTFNQAARPLLTVDTMRWDAETDAFSALGGRPGTQARADGGRSNRHRQTDGLFGFLFGHREECEAK
jgi:hypothetical protein